jgi:3-methyladenine DNA glycosylase AlkD
MTTLPARIRAALETVADPARAPGMQAYMKSAMPYLGVSSVPLRQVCKAVFADLQYDDSAAWQADVLALWRGAEFREERYAAIELTTIRAARPFQRIDALPMYEEMIVTGAWWDYVDAIATIRLWGLLDNDRPAMKAAMLTWSTDDDMWKRRSAILCQLPAKQRTDLPFLYACIAPSLESKEFFLRKAIGWALRQYARTDPAEVVRYVAEQGDRLSGLSRREALKRVPA